MLILNVFFKPDFDVPVFFISYEQVFRFFYFHNNKGKFSLRPGEPSAEVKSGAGSIADGRDHSFVAYRAARRYAEQFRFS